MKKRFRTLFFVFAIIFTLFLVSTVVFTSVAASKRAPLLQGEKDYAEVYLSTGSMAALYYAAQKNALLYEITAEQVRQYEIASGNDYYLPYDLNHKTFMAKIAPDVKALLVPLSNEKYKIVSQTVKSLMENTDISLPTRALEVDVCIYEDDRMEKQYEYSVWEQGVSREQCMEMRSENRGQSWDYYVKEEYSVSEALTALAYMPDCDGAKYSGSFGAWTEVSGMGQDRSTIVSGAPYPDYLQECEMVSYADFLVAYDGEEAATIQTAAGNIYTTGVIVLVSQAACLVVALACLGGWLIFAKRAKMI